MVMSCCHTDPPFFFELYRKAKHLEELSSVVSDLGEVVSVISKKVSFLQFWSMFMSQKTGCCQKALQINESRRYYCVLYGKRSFSTHQVAYFVSSRVGLPHCIIDSVLNLALAALVFWSSLSFNL